MSKLKYIILMLIFIIIIIAIFFITCRKIESKSQSIDRFLFNIEENDQYPKLDRSHDIKGIVTNNLGIRDDIYQWIKKQNFDEPKTKALIQEAKTTQAALLVNPLDKKAVLEIDEADIRSLKCLDLRFSYEELMKFRQLLEKFTVNTKERFLAYGKYNTALNGTTSTLPDGDTCEE